VSAAEVAGFCATLPGERREYSLGLAAGVGRVSRQLGHANPNITLEVYAHLLRWSR